MNNPVMTLRYFVDDEESREPVRVWWTTALDGYHASLITTPDIAGYTIVKHDKPFTDGARLDLGDLSVNYIELGRPDAGQLAVTLITLLINNSDQIIDHYIRGSMEAMASQ